MTNEQLINKIKVGEFNEYYEAVMLISNKALEQNNSFMRAFAGEYTYLLNDTKADHVAIENMDAFNAHFEEYLKNDRIPF